MTLIFSNDNRLLFNIGSSNQLLELCSSNGATALFTPKKSYKQSSTPYKIYLKKYLKIDVTSDFLSKNEAFATRKLGTPLVSLDKNLFYTTLASTQRNLLTALGGVAFANPVDLHSSFSFSRESRALSNFRAAKALSLFLGTPKVFLPFAQRKPRKSSFSRDFLCRFFLEHQRCFYLSRSESQEKAPFRAAKTTKVIEAKKAFATRKLERAELSLESNEGDRIAFATRKLEKALLFLENKKALLSNQRIVRFSFAVEKPEKIFRDAISSQGGESSFLKKYKTLFCKKSHKPNNKNRKQNGYPALAFYQAPFHIKQTSFFSLVKSQNTASLALQSFSSIEILSLYGVLVNQPVFLQNLLKECFVCVHSSSHSFFRNGSNQRAASTNASLSKESSALSNFRVAKAWWRSLCKSCVFAQPFRSKICRQEILYAKLYKKSVTRFTYKPQNFRYAKVMDTSGVPRTKLSYFLSPSVIGAKAKLPLDSHLLLKSRFSFALPSTKGSFFQKEQLFYSTFDVHPLKSKTPFFFCKLFRNKSKLFTRVDPESITLSSQKSDSHFVSPVESKTVFLFGQEQKLISTIFVSIGGASLSHCLFSLKQQFFTIKKSFPKIKIWSFAFGSSFLLVSITSLLQKQEDSYWFLTFFKNQMPGLSTTSQDSSCESFENITLKHLQRASYQYKFPRGKSLVEQIDCYKDIWSLSFSDSWTQQLLHNYAAVFCKSKAFYLSSKNMEYPWFSRSENEKALLSTIANRIEFLGKTKLDKAQNTFLRGHPFIEARAGFKEHEKKGDPNVKTSIPFGFLFSSKSKQMVLFQPCTIQVFRFRFGPLSPNFSPFSFFASITEDESFRCAKVRESSALSRKPRPPSLFSLRENKESSAFYKKNKAFRDKRAKENKLFVRKGPKNKWVVEPLYKLHAQTPPKKVQAAFLERAELSLTFAERKLSFSSRSKKRGTFDRCKNFLPKHNSYRAIIAALSDSIPAKMSSSIGTKNNVFGCSRFSENKAVYISNFSKSDLESFPGLEKESVLYKSKAKKIDQRVARAISPHDRLKNLFYKQSHFWLDSRIFHEKLQETDSLHNLHFSSKKIKNRFEKLISTNRFLFLQQIDLLSSYTDLSNQYAKTDLSYPLHLDKAFATITEGERKLGRASLFLGKSSQTENRRLKTKKPGRSYQAYQHRLGVEKLEKKQKRESSYKAELWASLKTVPFYRLSLLNREGERSKRDSYRPLTPKGSASTLKLSFPFLYKRKAISNRFMSGYHMPETGPLERQNELEKKPLLFLKSLASTSQMSHHRFSIKVPFALPFYQSKIQKLFALPDSLWPRQPNLLSDRQVRKPSAREEELFFEKDFQPFAKITEGESFRYAKGLVTEVVFAPITFGESFLFSLRENRAKGNFRVAKGNFRVAKARKESFSYEKLQPSFRYAKVRESSALSRKAVKTSFYLDKDCSRQKHSLSLKKIPYKQLFLNEVEEVKPLFDQINRAFRVSPYFWTFKKSLFTDYNDYQSWSKDTPTAIAISPSIEEEEMPEGAGGYATKTDSWIAEQALSNMKKDESLPSIQDPLFRSFVEKNKESRDRVLEIDEIKESESEQGVHNKSGLSAKGLYSEPSVGQLPSNDFLPDQDGTKLSSSTNKMESKSGASSIQDESSLAVGEEEDKKREVTKSEWLEQVREAEQLVEKRKDFQKSAYPNREALWGERLQLQPGMIPSLLVTDRKTSFFGVTNLFPKRLIALDQKQISSQILRDEQDKRSILAFERGFLTDKNTVFVEDFLKSGGLHNLKKTADFDSKKQKGQGFSSLRTKPRNREKSDLLPKVKGYGSRDSRVDPNFLSPSVIVAKASEKMLSTFDRNANDQKRESQTEFSNSFALAESSLCSFSDAFAQRKLSPKVIEAKTTSLSTPFRKRQHPIYAPNCRLRLRAPQPQTSSQGSSTQSRIDDLNLSQSHRWWQKRRISSSLLGAPSKRYLVMPEIKAADWRKIIEWQLKTYFLEEEKRVEPLVLQRNQNQSGLASSPKKQTKDFFKIKKIALYLPWTTLKKSLKKPFEWPLTGLSYGSFFQDKQLDSFFPGPEGQVATPQESRTKSRAAFFLHPSSYKGARSLQNKTGSAPLPFPSWIHEQNLSVSNLYMVRRGWWIRHQGRASSVKTKQTPLCFVSSIRPAFKTSFFKEAPLSSSFLQGKTLSEGAGGSATKDFNPTSTGKPDRTSLLKTESPANKKHETGVYKPFLFETRTKNSYLLLHSLLLAICLKRLLETILRGGKNVIIQKIKNSSLAVVLLPIFLSALSRKKMLPKAFYLKKRLKDLVGSEETVSSLSEIVWYLRNSCRGRAIPRGVVLVESLSSESRETLKAIGGEAQVPVIVQSLRALPFTQSHPQRRLETLLTYAQKQAPCILFLDDLDSIGGSRTLLLEKSSYKASQTTRRAVRTCTSLSSSFAEEDKLFMHTLRTEPFSRESSALSTFLSPSVIEAKALLCNAKAELSKWKKGIHKSSDSNRSELCTALPRARQSQEPSSFFCRAAGFGKNLRFKKRPKNVTLARSQKTSYKAELCTLLGAKAARRFRLEGAGGYATKVVESEGVKSEGAISSFLQKASKQERQARALHGSETEKVVEQRRVDLMLRLLTVMDGISDFNGVLIVTTSKNPAWLDPALLRPGRFEKLINLKLPNKKKRVELLKSQTSTLGHTAFMPWEYFGTQTQNMTGTEISSAINHSAFRAIIQSTVHTFSTLDYGIHCVNGDSFASSTRETESKSRFLDKSFLGTPPVTIPFATITEGKSFRYAKVRGSSALPRKRGSRVQTGKLSSPSKLEQAKSTNKKSSFLIENVRVDNPFPLEQKALAVLSDRNVLRSCKGDFFKLEGLPSEITKLSKNETALKRASLIAAQTSFYQAGKGLVPSAFSSSLSETFALGKAERRLFISCKPKTMPERADGYATKSKIAVFASPKGEGGSRQYTTVYKKGTGLLVKNKKIENEARRGRWLRHKAFATRFRVAKGRESSALSRKLWSAELSLEIEKIVVRKQSFLIFATRKPEGAGGYATKKERKAKDRYQSRAKNRVAPQPSIQNRFYKALLCLYVGQASLSLYFDSSSRFIGGGKKRSSRPEGVCGYATKSQAKLSQQCSFYTGAKTRSRLNYKMLEGQKALEQEKQPFFLQSTHFYRDKLHAYSKIKKAFFVESRRSQNNASLKKALLSKAKRCTEGPDYSMMVRGFYAAFQSCAENREALDLLADHLIRFKSLRLHESLRICSFYF